MQTSTSQSWEKMIKAIREFCAKKAAGQRTTYPSTMVWNAQKELDVDSTTLQGCKEFWKLVLAEVPEMRPHVHSNFL